MRLGVSVLLMLVSMIMIFLHVYVMTQSTSTSEKRTKPGIVESTMPLLGIGTYAVLMMVSLNSLPSNRRTGVVVLGPQIPLELRREIAKAMSAASTYVAESGNKH